MKSLIFSVATGAGLVCAAVGAGAPEQPAKNPYAGDEWKLPAETAQLKKADGIELLTGNCLLCHSVDYIATQPALTRAQWTAGVEKMRAKFGAVIPTNKVPAIVNYLTANYGRENPTK